MTRPEEIYLALRRPFPPASVKWLPGATGKDLQGNPTALAMPYITVRDVIERLNEVLGIDGWKDTCRYLPNGAVACRLSIRIPGSRGWVTREDIGAESEQPGAHDKQKAAVSDALKRVAVKFGIGLYLYRVPQQWVPYDPQKRRLLQTPSLPDWALPPRDEQVREEKRKAAEPRTAADLAPWLADVDRRALAAGYFKASGGMTAEVVARVRAVHKDTPAAMSNWSPVLVGLAVKFARAIWEEKKGHDALSQYREQVMHELHRIESSWDEFLDRLGEDPAKWGEDRWKSELANLRQLQPPVGE